MSIVVIWGEPGSGKTANAERLKEKYKCKRIIDEWPNILCKPEDGDLLLTQKPSSAPKGSTLIYIRQALA